jgi:hypothetical protein
MVAFQTGHGTKTSIATITAYNGVDGFVVAAWFRPYKKGGMTVLTMVLLISLAIIPTMERFAMVRSSTTGSLSVFQATASPRRVGNRQNPEIFLEDPNPSGNLSLPQVAWLMTYPNSVSLYV